MRPVPVHPASTSTPGHNPEAAGPRLSDDAPLVTDVCLEDLERDARHAIGEMAYAYYAGGADDERLLEENVAAWARWQLHPHVLAGLAEVSTETTLLGTRTRTPVAVAPTAIQGLAHPDGEVATARGAAAAGSLLILSSLATSRSRTWPPRCPRGRAGCRCTSCASGRGPKTLWRAPSPTAMAPSCSPSTRRCRDYACVSGARACTCPTTWLCPTWPAAARTARGAVGSWPSSPTSSSRRSVPTTSPGSPG